MNIKKRKNKHLSTIKTAHTLAGIFIFLGLLLIFICAVAGAFLFQGVSPTVNNTVFSVQDSLTEESSSPADTETEIPAAGLSNVTDSTILFAQEKINDIIKILKSLEWNDLISILVIAFVLLWLGYVLRILSILAETQFIDFLTEN